MRRHDGPDVDQRLRRDLVDVLSRHALAHDALHAGQTDPELVLDQLAHAADAAVAEVVDVVDLVAVLALPQLHEVVDGGLDVLGCEGGLLVGQRQPSFLLTL